MGREHDAADRALEKAVLEQITRTLASDVRLGLRKRLPTLALADGVLTIEGEVPDVRIKKLVLERVAAEPRVYFVIDRLLVTPAERMGDATIRDHLVASLVGDSTFDECAIDVVDGRKRVRVRHARAGAPERGEIRVNVTDGVVTLDGGTPSRNHARLAGVLAWWVPGTCDVKNGLGPRAPEPFDEGDLVEAVRIVLEKDPLVDAGQIGVSVKRGAVLLEGVVKSPVEREAAERDVWFVSGVDDVMNHIEVLH